MSVVPRNRWTEFAGWAEFGTLSPVHDAHVRAHPCYDPDGPFDHDWEYVHDTYGADDVIGGIGHIDYAVCKRCGHEDAEREAPYYEEWDL